MTRWFGEWPPDIAATYAHEGDTWDNPSTGEQHVVKDGVWVRVRLGWRKE